MTDIDEAQEYVVLLHRLGAAITAWSAVEHGLFDVASVCFKDELLNREAFALGVFSLEGFRATLGVVNGIVSRKLAGNTTEMYEWNRLVERAKAYSAHRKHLAHWRLQGYAGEKPGRRRALIPWVFPKSKSKR